MIQCKLSLSEKRLVELMTEERIAMQTLKTISKLEYNQSTADILAVNQIAFRKPASKYVNTNQSMVLKMKEESLKEIMMGFMNFKTESSIW
jgi:hypothetical protein